MPRIDVSSSYIRRQVAAGNPVRYLVPEGVARYMTDHELYKREGAAA
jgi:nicotinate-nucleotide adenylyltransferase